ncbi:MAG: hypothetical protein Q7U28_10640 [Aquabacterium sp.]|nr:hypothetical protein [Aquabacterium sp.]
MKFSIAFAVVHLCVVAGAAQAETSAPAQAADLTAMNIALVSASLGQYQKGVNEIVASRVALMRSVHRMAAEARIAVDREVAVLKQTGGADLVKLFDALREHGNQAALVQAQINAVEAAAKADIAAAYAPLAISTEKLDQAAQKFAALAKQQTGKERAQFDLQFLKDTKAETDKLQMDSAQKKEAGNAKLDGKVGGTTLPEASKATN